ncbi:MAG: Oxidoreductase, GMC family, partial [uncultured Acetobacteraceae bacterium]
GRRQLRLRHRGRRRRRFRARRAPDGGPRHHRVRAGGRPARPQPVDPHPRRLHQNAGRSVLHLAVQDRAHRQHRRPAHRHHAGAHPRRLLLRERHGVQPRPAGRPQRLGAARQPRLGPRRRAALLPPHRAAHRLRRRGARARGRHPRHRHGLDTPRFGGLHRRLRGLGHPAQPGLQQRRPGRRRLLPARHPPRPAGERGARLPQARAPAAQHRGPHQRPRRRHPVRRQARRRRPLPQAARRHGVRGAGAARGGAVQRHGEHGAAAAGFGRRPGGVARQARRAGGPRAARRGRELPRPLRLPHRDARQARRADAQPALPRHAAGRAGGALGRRTAEHTGHRAFARPRLLEVLRGAGRAGPAMRLHARVLRRGQSVRAGRLPRRDRGRVAAPAGKHRLGARPQRRRVGRPGDPAQLPVRPDGPPRPPGRDAAPAAHALGARTRPLSRSRNPARAGGAERRRAAGLRLPQRLHHLPPDRHGAHGPGHRPDRRGGRPAARARDGGAPGGGRLHHAEHALRQHLRHDHDDRGEGGGHDPRADGRGGGRSGL